MKNRTFIMRTFIVCALILSFHTISFAQSSSPLAKEAYSIGNSSPPANTIIISSTFTDDYDVTDVTPTPTPTPEPATPECVVPGDYYVESATDLTMVDLEVLQVSEAILAAGTAVTLDVIDGDGDGQLDIWIPDSPAEATQAAAIHFATEACEGEYPQHVSVTLTHNDEAKLLAYDSSGVLVSSATASSATSVQFLELDSSTVIQFVEITGREILLHEICYSCPIEEPTPIPPKTVIVTDDEESMADLSGDRDVDPVDDQELVIKWNIDEPGIKDFHVYVQTDSLGNPKYLGRTGNGEEQQLVWRRGNENIAGRYRLNGPESDHYYKFYLYVLYEGAPVSGPFTHKAPVYYYVGEEEPIITPTPEQPTKQVYVTDSLNTMEDLSHGEDIDPIDNRELVIRWNLDIPNAKDIHIYAWENNVGKPKYLGRTAVNFDYFVWKEGTRGLGGNFKEGPQDGSTYTFFLYVLRRGGPPAGPFTHEGSVQFTVGEEVEPTATPTLTPTVSPEPEISECVIPGDYYVESATELTTVELDGIQVSEAILADGTAVTLDVIDGDGDGQLDIWIPDSPAEATQAAAIHFATEACQEGDLQNASITLSHNDEVTLFAYDSSGVMVSSATATNATSVQTLELNSSTDLQLVEIVGSEILIHEICYSCYEEEEPTPTETPEPSKTVFVTDDEESMVDLSGDMDVDPAVDRELVIRWNLDIPNAKDIHIYALKSGEDQPKYLGRTDVNFDYFVWKEGVRWLGGHFKEGPQDGNTYTFFLYVLRRGGPPVGPFSHEDPVQFKVEESVEPTATEVEEETTPTPEMTPTLPPSPEECITASDVFIDPVTGLHETMIDNLIVAEAKLADGTQVPFDIVDCNGDGELDISIPWSEESASQKATIRFATETCSGLAPQQVEITLQHYFEATLYGLDDSDNVVASEVAASVTESQTLTLKSEEGIRTIEIEGAEICILKVCWQCELEVEPTMTSTPVETPTIKQGTPTPIETRIPVRRNTPKPTVSPKPVNTPKPTASPEPMDTPEPTETPEPTATPGITTTPTQPETTPEPTHEIEVTVSDHKNTFLDISGAEDRDNADNRELVIRWTTAGMEKIHSADVFVQVNDSERAILGTTGDDDSYFVWKKNAKGLFKDFRDGPQFGHRYLFSVVIYTQDKGITSYGPFEADGAVTYHEVAVTPPVPSPSPEETVSPTPVMEETPTPHPPVPTFTPGGKPDKPTPKPKPTKKPNPNKP